MCNFKALSFKGGVIMENPGRTLTENGLIIRLGLVTIIKNSGLETFRSTNWQRLETWGSGWSWRDWMGTQPQQCMTPSGRFYKEKDFNKINIDTELRERTRDTSCTLKATQAQLVTAWVITMVWSSPLQTETMTIGAAAVDRATNQAGGSLSNYLSDWLQKCAQLLILTSLSLLIFSCGASILNGKYGERIIWYEITGWYNSLKSTSMMISKKGD